MARLLIALVLIVWVGACTPPRAQRADSCRRVVASYDIGSAATKMQVALIDRCRATVVRRLARDARPVPYGDDVAKVGAVSQDTMSLGSAALVELAKRARAHAPDVELAVTTEALRRASNGDAVLRAISKAAGLRIRRVSQDEEAALAFWAVVKQRARSPERTIVWDVGGESMQLTSLVDGEVATLGLSFASGDMRRYLARDVQRKAPAASPNPVSRPEADVALAHARATLVTHPPSWLRRQLRHADVVGVGALRYYKDVNADPAQCSRAGLRRALNASLGRSDAEIGGAFAHARVPDSILFLSMLDVLGRDRIAVADIDLTDALVLSTVHRGLGRMLRAHESEPQPGERANLSTSTR